MKLRPEQLDTHLKRPLAPLYLVYGAELLLVQEACDAIRMAAYTQGYSEREVLHAEEGFTWARLGQAATHLSLFAVRRLIELRLSTPRIGTAGSQAVVEYAAAPAPDTVLLISAGELDAAVRASAWHRACERAGVVIPVWPVEARALPAWITARLARQGQHVGREAAQLIAERVEGNLMAAAQEITKLGLLLPAGDLAPEAVAAAVVDHARFEVYDVVDAALAGDAARVVRLSTALRDAAAEPVVLIGALARELRTLAALTRACAAGQGSDSIWAQFKVWERKKALLNAAAARHTEADCDALLVHLAHIDRVAKGLALGNAWDELLQLALNLAGLPILAATA